MINTDNSDFEKVAENSLDLISLMIALAFKWDKIEYEEKINSWMINFAKAMTVEEKTEFLTKAKELGLVE